MIDIESAEDEPEIAKIRDFFVTVTGGLEDIALRELKATLKGITDVQVHKRQRVSRIHFRYERSPRKLLELRCVEAVFARMSEFGGVTVGRPGLIRIAEAIASVDLAPGVVLYNILNGIPETSGVALNCTVGRGHRFSSSELHQILRVVLAETYDLDESELQGPYHLHVRVDGKKGLVGFRLTERQPGDLSDIPGDLSAPTARAIGALIRPEKGSTWIDLAARGGVLASTFSDDYGVRSIAAELTIPWLAEAGARLGSSGCLGVWDGQHLPFADGVADGIFLNRRRRREIRFDAGLQAQCCRVLSRHGQLVLMTDRDRDLESDFEAGRSVFRCSDRRPIHLGGDSLSLYTLRKHR